VPRSVIQFSDAFKKDDRTVEVSVESQIEQAITHIKRVKEGVKVTLNSGYPATYARGPKYYCRAAPADPTDATQAIADFSRAG
jgi:DNA polymerase elongation subunit (family B)